jgi:hypothetical protein
MFEDARGFVLGTADTRPPLRDGNLIHPITASTSPKKEGTVVPIRNRKETYNFEKCRMFNKCWEIKKSQPSRLDGELCGRGEIALTRQKMRSDRPRRSRCPWGPVGKSTCLARIRKPGGAVDRDLWTRKCSRSNN